MSSTLKIRNLIQSYLRSELNYGRDRLPLDENARLVLRAWMKAARAGRTSPQGVVAETAEAPQGSGATDAPNPVLRTSDSSPAIHPSSPRPSSPHSPSLSPHSPSPATPSPSASSTLPPSLSDTDSFDSPLPAHSSDDDVVDLFDPKFKEEVIEDIVLEDTPEPFLPKLSQPTGTPAEQIELLKKFTVNWPPYKNLDSLGTTLVFSSGNPNAEIFIINEYPNHSDEKSHMPLTGPAGEKFAQILSAMGLSREEVYVTNLVKFRPQQAGQTIGTRLPLDIERNIFTPIIEAEIDAVRPKVILILGEASAQALLKNESSLEELRTQDFFLKNTPTVVSYHPGYLLQYDQKEQKRRLWEDMLCVMKKARLPISERQANFFL